MPLPLVAVGGSDNVDEAQCSEASALPRDCEHQAGHDDGGGAVRTTAGDRCAGTAPLRWDLAAIRRGVAGDHALRDPRAIAVTLWGGTASAVARDRTNWSQALVRRIKEPPPSGYGPSAGFPRLCLLEETISLDG